MSDAPKDTRFRDALAELIAQAREEGAAEENEACARLADELVDVAPGGAKANGLRIVAEAIRARRGVGG